MAQTLLCFICVFLSQVAAASDCDDPQFVNDFMTVSSLDHGGRSLASLGTLAVIGGNLSPQYKEIERLAQTDKKMAQYKTVIDGITVEMKATFEKVKLTRSIQKQIRLKYEKMYGKNWYVTDQPMPDSPFDSANQNLNTDRVNAYYRELFTTLENKGLTEMKNPRIIIQTNPTVTDHAYIQDYKEKIEKRISQLPMETRFSTIVIELKNFAEAYVGATVKYHVGREGYWREYTLRKMVGAGNPPGYIGLDIESVWLDGALDREALAAHRESYSQALERLALSAQSKTKGANPDEDKKKKGSGGKGTAFGFGMLGIGGITALNMAGIKNAEAHIKRCKSTFMVDKNEVTILAQSLDPQTIPAAPDVKTPCEELKLMPVAAANLMRPDGTYSPGACQALHRQFDETISRYNKPFQINLKTCDNAPVTQGDATLGKFVRVSDEKSYFEVPAAENGYGARFYVDYTGDIDFDPQQIECTFNHNGKTTTRGSCISDIKDAIANGPHGALTPSVKMSRENLFNARRRCGKTDTLSLEPLCRFGKNAESIRQALGPYALRCMSLTDAASIDKAKATATH